MQTLLTMIPNILICCPILVGLAIMLLPKQWAATAKVTASTFGITMFIMLSLSSSTLPTQLYGASINLLCIMLSTLLMVFAILYEDDSKYQLEGLYLVLLGLLIGSFTSSQILTLYSFLLAITLVIFIILIGFGNNDRTYAAFKFVGMQLLLFTPLFMLISYCESQYGSNSLDELRMILPQQPLSEQKTVWWHMLAAATVLLPLPPFHIWLTAVKTQAPKGLAAVIAPITLQVGITFTLRWYQLLPEVFLLYNDNIIVALVVAQCYTGLLGLSRPNPQHASTYWFLSYAYLLLIAVLTGSASLLATGIICLILVSLVHLGLVMLGPNPSTLPGKTYSSIIFTALIAAPIALTVIISYFLISDGPELPIPLVYGLLLSIVLAVRLYVRFSELSTQTNLLVWSLMIILIFTCCSIKQLRVMMLPLAEHICTTDAALEDDAN